MRADKSTKARFTLRSHYDKSMPHDNTTQTLLIDADDTLWENNIYFERAIAKFISFLDHKEHSPEAIRLILNEVERQ